MNGLLGLVLNQSPNWLPDMNNLSSFNKSQVVESRSEQSQELYDYTYLILTHPNPHRPGAANLRWRANNGSGNGLSSVSHQAITWTFADL